MHDLHHDFEAGVLRSPPAPCVSLYQRTHRHHPQNQQDPIRFTNLVKTLQRALREHRPAAEVETLLAPLYDLARDDGFWMHTREGLAVLAAKDLFRVYLLDRPVPERAIVADSFHTKPLLRILQSADRYQVLVLSRQDVRMFEGNRDVLDEIELHALVPRTLTEALGEEKTDSWLTGASYGGAASGKPAMRHGHGGKKPEIDIDAERVVPGRLDRASGEVDFDQLEHPEVDDILDDLAEITLAKGGDVMVIPTERMPSTSGAAAIYRY